LSGDIGPIGSANIGAASAIFDGRGSVLLVKHTYGHFNWEIPGGICLPAEPPSVGAQRELREETSLDLPEGALSGVYYEPRHTFGGAAIHFVFRFMGQEGLIAQANPPEIGDVGWFELGNLPAPMSDFTETRIRDALTADVAYRVISGRTWRT
jgi:8-oxo-dGTP pyrophosphatase MutT (NUDIX family)